MDTLSQKIESLIFVAGKPLSLKKIAELCGCDLKQVRDTVKSLSDEYKSRKSGINLTYIESEACLVSAPEAGKIVQKFLKEDMEGKLSKAALETLAIIAYRQPITRPVIDSIRGVNSSIMLRTLLLRGLIDRQKSSSDQRLFEYSITFDFMKILGISKKEDLPNYGELKNSLIKKGIETVSQDKLTIENKDSATETDDSRQ